MSGENELWKDRRVLVTGAGGFIGSCLAERLHSLGAFVVAMVNDSSMWKIERDRFKTVLGDVRDYSSIRSIISFYEIEVVYHLAAFAIVRVSSRDPVSTYETNVMGTVNVLDVCRNTNTVKRIVVASSDKSYGDHDTLPYVEDFQLKPKNTYDTSKACMDLISQSFAHNYDMNICVTRCSNVYGPGDMNVSRIIPNTIRRILDGKKPFLYEDVSDMEREFIFIDDVVDAYILLGLTDNDHVVYNIGGTGPVRVFDLVKKISSMMGLKKSEPFIGSREVFFREIQKQYIDASRLESLGWRASTDLDTGLARTIDWYRKL